MSSSSAGMKPAITIIGAGIAGSWQALMLAEAGYPVRLVERSGVDLSQSATRDAGGMLAPWCEAESAEPVITRLGLRSLALWRKRTDCAEFNGSLVLALPRDRTELARFAGCTSGHRALDRSGLAALEPALAERFDGALFYEGEGHLEPRAALPRLHAALAASGCAVEFETAIDPDAIDGVVIDCRGLAARDRETELRGVKGEAIVVESDEIALARPVRLLHPRWPLYIVPRPGHRFMIGATSIETEREGMIVRSALELLTAAYAVHPAFAEARIVELAANFRPAYPDNLPRIAICGRRISVNGLYRHGFLLAPALAELTLAYLDHNSIDAEVMQCA
jgi:glycine oxidase